MFAEYERAEAVLTALGEPPGLFPTQKTILTKNLFGIDLNGEAVEVARLSAWIKTARVGETLTALDGNIVQGNSVAAPPSPLEAWRSRFPAAMNAGGFDVVIGNPPYVRQEWIKADKPFLQQHYKAYDGVADMYVYFYELGLNILKPGGRLGFIVTNKWMRAGYGENLRKLYADAAWVEQVVDFGQARQIFPDADVFPCIVVARKPTDGPSPADARVCAIPREQLRIDDLSRQIAAEGVAVPRSRFGAEPWNLEPPGVAALMAKIKANGVPLKEFAGCTPLYGIKTGYNEAYLIDTPTKDRLVAADPRSEPLFKPYLRGQDIARWQPEWNGLWMVVMKSSVNHEWPWSKADDPEAAFRATYPALHAHMAGHADKLKARQDQGEHWWELRQCAYWADFDKPKLIYPEITWQCAWCYDSTGFCINNTGYIATSSDLWPLAVMNSPLMWFYSWRTAQHGKDEALRFFRDYVQDIPIAVPSPEQRAEVEQLVARLIDLKGGRADGGRDVLQWLQAEFGVGKPSNRLAALTELTADAFLAEVKKLRGRSRPLSVSDVRRLHDAYAESVLPLHANARETLHLERRVADLVHAAYKLTPEDVSLLWQTAPPRMPLPAPEGTPGAG